jgi:hypothetical protein
VVEFPFGRCLLGLCAAGGGGAGAFTGRRLQVSSVLQRRIQGGGGAGACHRVSSSSIASSCGGGLGAGVAWYQLVVDSCKASWYPDAEVHPLIDRSLEFRVEKRMNSCPGRGNFLLYHLMSPPMLRL